MRLKNVYKATEINRNKLKYGNAVQFNVILYTPYKNTDAHVCITFCVVCVQAAGKSRCVTS